MAQRGGQPGNKNGAKNRPWAEAINRALLADNGKKLRALAEKIIEKALEGDVPAMREVGDRVDGKAIQALSGPDGGPIEFHEVVRRIA